MIATSGGTNKVFMRACNHKDVFDAVADDNVNRRNTDVPLPRGLCLNY